METQYKGLDSLRSITTFCVYGDAVHLSVLRNHRDWLVREGMGGEGERMEREGRGQEGKEVDGEWREGKRHCMFLVRYVLLSPAQS